MKVLLVHGEDFAALNFENQHRGVSIDEIISNPSNFLPKEENDEYEQWSLKVFEFEGTVDKNFVDFIRDKMIDYDHSKDIAFYMEGETVRE